MSAFVQYRKVTSEPREAEVSTVSDLLRVVQEAGYGTAVRLEVFDAEGRRHDIQATYAGESTGLARAAINLAS